jgi:hypothetical protein
MGAGPADSLDAEGKRGVLQNGKVAESEDLAEEDLPVRTALFQQLVYGGGRIAKPCSSGDDLLRLGRMG